PAGRRRARMAPVGVEVAWCGVDEGTDRSPAVSRADAGHPPGGPSGRLPPPPPPSEGEQRARAVKPAAVAGQGAGGADDPVAGEDDRDRVAAVGHADGPARAGTGEPGGGRPLAGGGGGGGV